MNGILILANNTRIEIADIRRSGENSEEVFFRVVANIAIPAESSGAIETDNMGFNVRDITILDESQRLYSADC